MREGSLPMRMLLALVVSALVLAACGGGQSPTSSPPQDEASTPSGVTGVRERQRAPDFDVRTTDATTFRLSTHRGQVVVLDFLAPGCPSCAAEVPSLAKVWSAFKGRGAVVLLIDIGGVSADEVVRYYRGELGGGDHLYAVDEGFKVATAYKVLALGTTVIVGRDGVVTYRDSGVTQADLLLREVREALA